jgi:hypothetical protein
VSVAAAGMGFEPVSPELVLVAGPDERDRARALLPLPERWAPAAVAAAARNARLSFAAFCGTCAVMTLAPLALVLLAR